jgi:hypothetical protein
MCLMRGGSLCKDAHSSAIAWAAAGYVELRAVAPPCRWNGAVIISWWNLQSPAILAMLHLNNSSCCNGPGTNGVDAFDRDMRVCKLVNPCVNCLASSCIGDPGHGSRCMQPSGFLSYLRNTVYVQLWQ